MAALTLVEKVGGYLVLDDVVWEKRGKLIEGVARLFMSSEKRYVLGLNAVVLGWTNGKGCSCRSPSGSGRSPAGETRTARCTRTSPSTARRTAPRSSWPSSCWSGRINAVSDPRQWPSTRHTLQSLRYLRSRDWHWVARIKGNRKMTIGGKTFRPDAWEAEAKAGRAPALGRSVVAHLPGWGQVRVIASRLKEDGSIRFLVGSNVNWGRGCIDRLYGHRWAIEPGAFRDGKQLAGLGDCQARSFRAQENHFALALLALVFVAYQARRSESTAQAIHRLSDRPIDLAAPPAPAKVQPIKLERRQKRQDARPMRRSNQAA